MERHLRQQQPTDQRFFYFGREHSRTIELGKGCSPRGISQTLIRVACVFFSGDSQWNSWSRVPYITNIRTGSPSIIPADRKIHNNFILAVSKMA